MPHRTGQQCIQTWHRWWTLPIVYCMHAHHRVCTVDIMPENGVDLHTQPAPALLHTPASSPSNLFIRCHRKAALLMQEVKWIRTATTCCWLSYAALRCSSPIFFDLRKCICLNAVCSNQLVSLYPHMMNICKRCSIKRDHKLGVTAAIT